MVECEGITDARELGRRYVQRRQKGELGGEPGNPALAGWQLEDAVRGCRLPDVDGIEPWEAFMQGHDDERFRA